MNDDLSGFKFIVAVFVAIFMFFYVYALFTQPVNGKIYQGTEYDDFFDIG